MEVPVCWKYPNNFVRTVSLIKADFIRHCNGGRPASRSAPMDTTWQPLYPVFSPLPPPSPLFPHWLGTPGSQSYQRIYICYLLVNLFVIWCQSVAILSFPRCLSALLVVLIWWFASKSSLNKDHRGGGWCQAFPCLFRRFLGHAMTCSLAWSGAGYSCSVYDKI